MLMLAQRFAAYGLLGLLVEVLFTGIHSIIVGNRAATGRTYLWMFFVWGSGGTILELIREWTDTSPNLWWHTTARAVLLTIAIFITEFSWGLFFEKFPLTKKCMWKYMDPITHEKIHRFSLMGFVRADYAIYWYGLAVLFDVFSPKIKYIINTISRL